jgi:hypothetical protein
MIDRIKKMCILGAKTSLYLKHTKEEALEFLKESFLKIEEVKSIEEQFITIAKDAIDKVYQSTDEKVKIEFDACYDFMKDYENSEGKDVDDKGHDEADRAALAAIEILSKAGS